MGDLTARRGLAAALRAALGHRTRPSDVVVEAAGGVVWRCGANNGIEVLVVHRPRYDDWSLPKGKLERGEPHLDGALREVAEETGLLCQVGDELDEVRYEDRRGRVKRVRYWAMQPVSGGFTPNHEVDEVRWLPAEDAAASLTHERDSTKATQRLAERVGIVGGGHVVDARGDGGVPVDVTGGHRGVQQLDGGPGRCPRRQHGQRMAAGRGRSAWRAFVVSRQPSAGRSPLGVEAASARGGHRRGARAARGS